MNTADPPLLNKLVSLKNKAAVFTVDMFGAAYVGLKLGEAAINPFGFKYKTEQMPWNNLAGSVFKGHFACIGRWGEPTLSEKQAGIPNHGDFCNILWQQEGLCTELKLIMKAESAKEGFSVTRTIVMDPQEPIIFISEEIKNINPIGRLFNIVQHPTFTSPFVDNHLRIDCNGKRGFNQVHYHPEMDFQTWPTGLNDKYEPLNLHKFSGLVNEVFTYEVDRNASIGWVTIYSPTFNILLGYVFKRTTYPWLHFWHHHDKGKPYLAAEFGTAALHKDFKQLLKNGNKVINDTTLSWIDPDIIFKKNFIFFSTYLNNNIIEGVFTITIANKDLEIKCINNKMITIHSSYNLYDML